MKTNCIKEVKKYIEEHFTENILLDDISKLVGYSKFHLNRLFLEDTGLTIYQYIKERRLSEAANQLMHTDKSIIEIALDVGYMSQQSFTFAFKQMYQCTPQVYRKTCCIYHINHTLQVNGSRGRGFFMDRNGGIAA